MCKDVKYNMKPNRQKNPNSEKQPKGKCKAKICMLYKTENSSDRLSGGGGSAEESSVVLKARQ